MQIPVQVTFRGVPRSDDIEALIRNRASALEKFHGRITGCHVVVSASRRRTGDGISYSVGVDLIVPGGEILANKDHRLRPRHQELEPAIERAFAVARRRLEDFVRRVRGSARGARPARARGLVRVAPSEDVPARRAAAGS
jgi:hypothetical protein